MNPAPQIVTAGVVADAVNHIAPLSGAESWDNVGLLVGERSWPARRILLTIDLTDAVLAEAVRDDVQFIVAYHPLIFRPITRLTDADAKTRIALAAAQASIAVHSPHTALDAAPGGVNDWLAAGCGEGTTTAIAPHAALPPTETHKLVTFCPVGSVQPIRAALGDAGAGRIGDYEQCAFEIAGHGTFRGGATTNPTIGEPGVLEHVDEIRLEMVCGSAELGAVIAALRAVHPYEEPAFEVHPLAPRPSPERGAGRRLALTDPVDLKTLVARLKSHLGVDRVEVATGSHAPRRYSVIGLCPGAGGSLLEPAIAAGCELFLTGEMRHHDVLAAQAAGCTVVLAGHTHTERGYLKVLRDRLAKSLRGARISVARRDRHPLVGM